jgi:hypothetical protein
MHSLEPEVRTLHRQGVLDDAAAAHAVALENRTLFSVFQELRAVLYAAVAAISVGIGIFLKQNIDRIGPVAIIAGLAGAAAVCYVFAVRMHRRGLQPSVAADYVLVLGALIVSADLGFAEAQFHWFGADWARHLLILAAVHAATAYWLESPLVLSLSLASFAGWIGVERSFGNLLILEHAAPSAGGRALLCAALILAWREIHRRLNASRLMQEVLEHFAANLGFWGGLAWCSSDERRGAGLMVVVALGFVAIRHGIRRTREIFVIYGIVYGAVALCIVEGTLKAAPLAAALMQLFTVTGSAWLLWRLHGQARRTAE